MSWPSAPLRSSFLQYGLSGSPGHSLTDTALCPGPLVVGSWAWRSLGCCTTRVLSGQSQARVRCPLRRGPGRTGTDLTIRGYYSSPHLMCWSVSSWSSWAPTHSCLLCALPHKFRYGWIWSPGRIMSQRQSETLVAVCKLIAWLNQLPISTSADSAIIEETRNEWELSPKHQ